MKNKEQTKSPRELIRETDRLLKRAGYDIFGKNRGESNYFQILFDHRMQTGAYCKNSERR